MKKSKILSLILCVMLVIAFASLDASAADVAQDVKIFHANGDSVYTEQIHQGKKTSGTAETFTPNCNADKNSDQSLKTENDITFTVVTAGEEEEKLAGDKYYRLSDLKAEELNIAELKIGGSSGTNGDTFISFDFKGDTFDYISIKGTVLQKITDAETGAESLAPTGYKVAELFRVSPVSGIVESGKTILGDPAVQNEILVPVSKIRKNKWNSIQAEICCVKKELTITLNGEKFVIDASGVFEDSNGYKTKVDYGFYAFGFYLKGTSAADSAACIDNLYMHGGKEDAPYSLSETFWQTDSETGEHYGHLGALAEYTVSSTMPTVTSAYGVEARQKGNNLLYYKKTDGNYVGSPDVQHFYVKPNAKAADAISNTVTSNSKPVGFFSDTNLVEKYTGEETLPDECIALLPVTDGNGTVRTFTEYSVGAGPFDFGHSQMNNTSNIHYSVLGFNPTITSDEAKSLFNGKKLVIPDSFGGLNVGGIAHYAFYKEASGETPEVTYPEIDFDLSKVKSSGECWPGQYAFSKTGITKVEFSTRGFLQQRAFQDCDKLEYVDLTNCAGGQWHAFRFCDNLTTVKADDLQKWSWGGCVAPFADCPKFEEITLNSMTYKTFIDHQLLQGATSLKTIKVMDAADSNKKYLDNNVNIYAAAYDESGKMISISLLKKVNESDNFKTLSVPQTGKYIKIFQLAKSGNLVPATSITTIK